MEPVMLLDVPAWLLKWLASNVQKEKKNMCGKEKFIYISGDFTLLFKDIISYLLVVFSIRLQ